jgi:urea transporter
MNDSVNSTASIPESDLIPYWRLTLRGCSQLCFQSNEWTGLLFVLAVLVASPISAAYLLVAAIIAPAGRLLLEKKPPTLTTGLPGLNPCLIAISLPAFFHTGWTNVGMWMVLLVCVASAVVLVRLFLAVLPFPILVLPFLIIFWGLYALAPHFDILQPIAFAVPHPTTFHPLTAVLSSLGESLFAPSIWSGLLFGAGVLLSNWRHGLVAIFGATIGTAVSYYYHDADPASANLGLYGFNGVLTAVSVFVFCGGKLRLSILGALVATILTPAVAAFGVQTVSAPYVFTTWLMLALGWVEDHWFAVEPAPYPAAAVPSKSETTSQPAYQ